MNRASPSVASVSSGKSSANDNSIRYIFPSTTTPLLVALECLWSVCVNVRVMSRRPYVSDHLMAVVMATLASRISKTWRTFTENVLVNACHESVWIDELNEVHVIMK